MARYEIIGISCIIIFIILLIFVLKIILAYPEFRRELRYIDSEIHRTHGREKEYWKRRRRRLIKRFFRSI